MTRIGITGHRGLPAATTQLIDHAIHDYLALMAPPVVGVTCIADGADSIFARAVLDLGGTLEVIVPATHYRDALPAEHHPTYDQLLASATNVHHLAFTDSTSESHMEASRLMTTIIDQLLAVWDGQPARGYGGTADVVTHAHHVGLPVHIIWPPGAQRD